MRCWPIVERLPDDQAVHPRRRAPHLGGSAALRINNPDGEVEHLIRQIIDITEQVESRRRLEEARIKRRKPSPSRGLIDNSIIATALANLDGRLVQFNQAMCDLVGMTRARWRQCAGRTSPPRNTSKRNSTRFRAVISGEIGIYRARKKFLHADGRRVWGYLSLSVLRNADGDPQHLIAQVADITADVEMREQLEEARRLSIRGRRPVSPVDGQCRDRHVPDHPGRPLRRGQRSAVPALRLRRGNVEDEDVAGVDGPQRH